MPDLDALFPDKYDCFLALFQDSVYLHDKDYKYVIDSDGHFVRRNRVTVVKNIMAIAEYLYDLVQQKNPNFSRCEPFVNYSNLLHAINRYSRDIYGFQRIKARLNNLNSNISDKQKIQLMEIIDESADFGFKFPTDNPYIEKKVAVLLYWFSILKPFHLTFKKGKEAIPNKNFQAYFNEYFSYHLICTAVHPQSFNLIIHKDKPNFLEFLNQLHFRNLSRSSLEFFLPYWSN